MIAAARCALFLLVVIANFLHPGIALGAERFGEEHNVFVTIARDRVQVDAELDGGCRLSHPLIFHTNEKV